MICCNHLVCSLSMCFVVSGGAVSWTGALYWGGIHWCSACCGHVGAVCWKHWSAFLIYPGIERPTVLFS